MRGSERVDLFVTSITYDATALVEIAKEDCRILESRKELVCGGKPFHFSAIRIPVSHAGESLGNPVVWKKILEIAERYPSELVKIDQGGLCAMVTIDIRKHGNYSIYHSTLKKFGDAGVTINIVHREEGDGSELRN